MCWTLVIERVALLETKIRARTKREVTFIVMICCVRKIVFLILIIRLTVLPKTKFWVVWIKRLTWTDEET